jgi:N-methylhydantoinase A
VEVDVAGGTLTAGDLEAATQRFHQRHEDLYTFKMLWKGVEFLTFRLRATAPRAAFQLREIGRGGPDAAAALKRRRACWFDGQEVDAPVYDGTRLLAGHQIHGPAIIEETTTTVVIPTAFACTVDQWKNYILTRQRAGASAKGLITADASRRPS